MTAAPSVQPPQGDNPSLNGGTGVFIPQCILDGSALTNPALFGGKPGKKRRGGNGNSDGKQQGSPNKGSDASKPQKQQASAAPTTSAKNPFAATPKNIRQQQLLCNLVAAADSFSGAAAASATPAASLAASISPSIDLPVQPASLAAAAAASASSRGSFDMPCAGTRASMEFNYHRWAACDSTSACPSHPIDLGSMSVRSSMDCHTSYSRQSMDIPSISSYVATTQAAVAQQQYASRASMDAGCIPPFGRQSAWANSARASMELQGRPSIDLVAPRVPFSRSQRSSLDMPTGDRGSLDMVAPSHRLNLNLPQQHHVRPVRRDSSNLSNASSGNSSASTFSLCSSMDCSMGSIAANTDMAAATAAAALASQQAAAAGGWELPSQAALLQLQHQQLLVEGAANAAASQNLLLHAAAAQQQAMLLSQACTSVDVSNMGFLNPTASQAAVPAAAVSTCAPAGDSPSKLQQELALIQQQLQQVMQAKQMAAAAGTALQATGGRLSAEQKQQLQSAQALQTLIKQQNAVLGEQVPMPARYSHGTPLDTAVNAVNLQQQLEMLQLMQL